MVREFHGEGEDVGESGGDLRSSVLVERAGFVYIVDNEFAMVDSKRDFSAMYSQKKIA